MEAGIQQHLAADVDVAAIVAKRIYPLLLPDTRHLPAVTYQRVSTTRDYTTTGPVSLTHVRLQIDSWGSTYAEAKTTAEAILRSLEAFTGLLPDGTHVDSIMLDASYDLYDEDARSYRVSSDYLISAVL